MSPYLLVWYPALVVQLDDMVPRLLEPCVGVSYLPSMHCMMFAHVLSPVFFTLRSVSRWRKSLSSLDTLLIYSSLLFLTLALKDKILFCSLCFLRNFLPFVV